MKLLALTDGALRLGVRGESLVVLRGEVEVQTVGSAEVEEVHLYGAADLTPAARSLVLRKGIEVAILTADGRWRGRLTGGVGAWAARRVAQVQVHADPARRLAVAQALIAAKLAAQRDHLLARQRHLRDPEVAAVATSLRASGRQVLGCETCEEVLGVEGMGAKRYYGVFDQMLRAPGMSWQGRNRRPPRDPPNAALSYGYTLLVARVESSVRRAGLDPWVGMLHGITRGAPALALDLAEPWRPWVDRMVLTLLNRQGLVVTDFETPPVGEGDRDPGPDAVYLGRTGRQILLRAWEQQRRDPVAVDGEGRRLSLDLALDEAVHRLRRFLEGESEGLVALGPKL